MRNLFCMWMGEVAMKVWMRPCLAGLIASPAARTSFSLARASEHTVECSIDLGDAVDRIGIAGAGGRKARLDHIHAQFFQLARDAQFLFLGHGCAGALLAVAQGCVEYD